MVNKRERLGVVALFGRVYERNFIETGKLSFLQGGSRCGCDVVLYVELRLRERHSCGQLAENRRLCETFGLVIQSLRLERSQELF